MQTDSVRAAASGPTSATHALAGGGAGSGAAARVGGGGGAGWGSVPRAPALHPPSVPTPRPFNAAARGERPRAADRPIQRAPPRAMPQPPRTAPPPAPSGAHLTADGDPNVTTSAASACASSPGSALRTPTVSYVRMQLTLNPLASSDCCRSPEARADAG
jgi:hypothetical protein